MIDTKKEQERDELHRAIWAIADELRGTVDGWDFKNYLLLSVSPYVEVEDTREKIDIVKLNADIEEIVAREQVLRDEIAKNLAEIDLSADGQEVGV